jgi:hypothetical protein
MDRAVNGGAAVSQGKDCGGKWLLKTGLAGRDIGGLESGSDHHQIDAAVFEDSSARQSRAILSILFQF